MLIISSTRTVSTAALHLQIESPQIALVWSLAMAILALVVEWLTLIWNEANFEQKPLYVLLNLLPAIT